MRGYNPSVPTPHPPMAPPWAPPSPSGRGVALGSPMPEVETLTEAKPAGPGPLAGLRILVVEDEPDARELLLALFEVCGAQGHGASSAAEALDLVRAGRPDLIVADVGLAGEEGLSFLRTLRNLPGGDMPAVALTAFVRPEDRDEALAAGYDAHVGKPIEPERLLRIVTMVLRERRSRERACGRR